MKNNQKGLTRIETILATVAFLLLLGLSVPSFLEIVKNTQLKELGDKMVMDFEQAQSEAVKRKQSVFISATASEASWCYGVSVDKACDCTQVNSCQLDGVNTAIQSVDYGNVTLVTSSSLLGEPLEFTPSGAVGKSRYLEFSNSMGKKLGVKLTSKGVVDKCSDSAAWGYPSC